jgi:hypothetical protein
VREERELTTAPDPHHRIPDGPPPHPAAAGRSARPVSLRQKSSRPSPEKKPAVAGREAGRHQKRKQDRMPKAIIAAFSNPASPEVEDEFNTWYDQVHLQEILGIPGVTAGTRYRLADGANPFPQPHRYLAIYQLDVEPDTVLAEMSSGRLSPSPDLLDRATAQIASWVALDPPEITP